MHRLGTTARPAIAVAAACAAILALGACTSNRAPGASGSGSASSASSAPVTSSAASTSTTPTSAAPPAVPATITTSPLHSTGLSPRARVSVAIAHGTLTSVKMTNPAGKVVSGALDTTHATWHNTEDLGYSKTYHVTALGKDADGKPVVKHTAYTTLTPGNQTMPYLQRIGGYPLDRRRHVRRRHRADRPLRRARSPTRPPQSAP